MYYEKIICSFLKNSPYILGMVRLSETQNNLSSNKRQVDLARQMSLLRAATTTRIVEDLSPTNVTVIHGENTLLVCTILNIGDKSVCKENF